ncbi:conserved hypothetical protein, partial [sediment metagenome]
IARALEFQVGLSWEMARKGTILEQRHAWHNDGAAFREFVTETRKFTFGRGTGLPGRVWEQKAVCWIADVAQDANVPRSAIASRAGLTRAIALNRCSLTAKWSV